MKVESAALVEQAESIQGVLDVANSRLQQHGRRKDELRKGYKHVRREWDLFIKALRKF